MKWTNIMSHKRDKGYLIFFDAVTFWVDLKFWLVYNWLHTSVHEVVSSYIDISVIYFTEETSR